MTVILRPYQLAAVDEIRARIAAGSKRIVVVSPTGSGKTTIFSYIAQKALALRTRTLITAHRRELIKQPFCRLVRFGISPQDIGVMLAGIGATPVRGPVDLSLSDDDLWKTQARRRPMAPIQVGSIDTMRAREAYPQADLIILDESHRALAKSYLDLMRANPNAIVLGPTATPYLGNGRGLGEDPKTGETVFDDLVVVASYSQLVAEGFLVEPRVFTVPVAELPDLSRVKVKGGEYNEQQLALAVDQGALVGSIVDHWERRGNSAPTLGFAVNVAHSKHIVERFLERNIAAQHVDANTPGQEREEAIRRLKRGDIKVLSNVDVFSTGTDITCVKTIGLWRPTMSEVVYRQQVGRGSRPDPNGLPFVVLDHAGLAIEFGLPQDEKEYSLESTRRGPSGSARAKVCPGCQSMVALGCKVCPECSHEFGGPEATERKPPEEMEGELVEVRPANRAERKEVWDRLCAEALANSHKQGWVRSQYVDLFSSPPPADWKAPDMRAANAEHVAAFDLMVREAHAKGHKLGAAKYRFKESIGNWPSNKVMSSSPLAVELGGLEALDAELERRAEEVATERLAEKVREKAARSQAPVVKWAV